MPAPAAQRHGSARQPRGQRRRNRPGRPWFRPVRVPATPKSRQPPCARRPCTAGSLRASDSIRARVISATLTAFAPRVQTTRTPRRSAASISTFELGRNPPFEMTFSRGKAARTRPPTRSGEQVASASACAASSISSSSTQAAPLRPRCTTKRSSSRASACAGNGSGTTMRPRVRQR